MLGQPPPLPGWLQQEPTGAMKSVYFTKEDSQPPRMTLAPRAGLSSQGWTASHANGPLAAAVRPQKLRQNISYHQKNNSSLMPALGSRQRLAPSSLGTTSKVRSAATSPHAAGSPRTHKQAQKRTVEGSRGSAERSRPLNILLARSLLPARPSRKGGLDPDASHDYPGGLLKGPAALRPSLRTHQRAASDLQLAPTSSILDNSQFRMQIVIDAK